MPGHVVGDPAVPAVEASFGVAAERSGTAMFDSRHDLALVEAQMSGMRNPVRRAGRAEDVGGLGRGPHRTLTRGDVLPSIRAINRSSGPVTAWDRARGDLGEERGRLALAVPEQHLEAG